MYCKQNQKRRRNKKKVIQQLYPPFFLPSFRPFFLTLSFSVLVFFLPFFCFLCSLLTNALSTYFFLRMVLCFIRPTRWTLTCWVIKYQFYLKYVKSAKKSEDMIFSVEGNGPFIPPPLVGRTFLYQLITSSPVYGWSPTNRSLLISTWLCVWKLQIAVFASKSSVG